MRRRAALMTIAAVASALAAASAVPTAAQQNRYAPQKVAYHVSQPGGENLRAYRAALGNVQNHINAVGAERIEVAVVMHGDGLGLLSAAQTDQKLQMQVASLRAQKVVFLVCRNTLTQRKIDPDKDLFEVASEDIVPSGVAELSRLQQSGYTYVRP